MHHVATTTTVTWTMFPGLSGGDLLGALVNFVGILAAITTAVWLTPWLTRRGAARDQRERLLRTLVNTWHSPQNPEYQTAIALVPLDFKHAPDVLAARVAYLEVVNRPAPEDTEGQEAQFKAAQELQIQLICAMAAELDVEMTVDSLRSNAYVTQAFSAREKLFVDAMISWQRIAAALEESNRMFAPQAALAVPAAPENPAAGADPAPEGGKP